MSGSLEPAGLHFKKISLHLFKIKFISRYINSKLTCRSIYIRYKVNREKEPKFQCLSDSKPSSSILLLPIMLPDLLRKKILLIGLPLARIKQFVNLRVWNISPSSIITKHCPLTIKVRKIQAIMLATLNKKNDYRFSGDFQFLSSFCHRNSPINASPVTTAGKRK
jgi:hypothetical protein